MKESKDYVIGIGIDNLGYHPTYGAIIKGKEYVLPVDFDFKSSALFKKKKEEKAEKVK